MIVYANILHTIGGEQVFEKIWTAIQKWGEDVRKKNGSNCEIETASHASTGQFPRYNHYAISHPDGGGNKGRQWFSRIGVKQEHLNGGCKVSVVVETRDMSVVAGSAPATATRPRVVEAIVQVSGGLVEPSPKSRVSILRAGDASSLELEIEDEMRDYAIILISQDRFSEQFPFDPAKLLSQVLGLAHVYQMETKRTGRAIEEILGSERSAWDGGINILYPRRTGSNYVPNHVFSRNDLKGRGRNSDERISFLLQFITHRFNLPRLQGEIGLTDLRHADFQQKLHEAQSKGASDRAEVEVLYQEEVRALTEQIQKEKETANSNYKAWEEASLKLEEKERENQGLIVYRDSLISQLKDTKGAEVEIPPQTVNEAIDRALCKYPEAFIFSPNSKSQHKNSRFRHVEKLAQGLDWLAKTYKETRSGAKRVLFLHKEIQEACPGWNYSARQSEVTAGDYREWYECQFNGSKHQIHEHISYGQAHNPEQTIRVAFCWLEDSKKILIGFVGCHQRTTAT